MKLRPTYNYYGGTDGDTHLEVSASTRVLTVRILDQGNQLANVRLTPEMALLLQLQLAASLKGAV